MKILVISLMRMGDLIMQRSLLRAINEKYPNAEIHLLINDLTKPVTPVIHEVENIHIFPRKILQNWMNSSESPLLQPYHYLNSFVKTLSDESFDAVYNFTHTKLSAYLMAMISCPVKHGLVADGFAFRTFENRWMHYFNERFTSRVPLSFHYIELLGLSLNLKPIWPKNENITKRNNVVFISVFSSDEKKNWSLKKFQSLKIQLEQKYSNLIFKILCAKSEVLALSSTFEMHEIVSADFKDSEIFLQNAFAIITIDSVMKHLAAENSTPILEISTGSSDPQRTGPLSDQSVVVFGQSHCYPCKHSNECPELSFLCSDGVSVQSVFLAFEQLCSQYDHSFENLSNRFASPRLNSNLGYLIGTTRYDQQLLNKLILDLSINQTKINFRKPLLHPIIEEIYSLKLESFCINELKQKNINLLKFSEIVMQLSQDFSENKMNLDNFKNLILKSTKFDCSILSEIFTFIDKIESVQDGYELHKAILNLQKDIGQFEKINLILMKQLRGEFYGRESQSLDQEQNFSS